jgi:hypothetical protein
MKTIVLCGWKAGFRKVSLTVLLREKVGYSLAHAKAATDAVLDNQSITIEVRDEEMEAIAKEINDIGVKISHGPSGAANPTR